MADVHCFDVTEIRTVAVDLAGNVGRIIGSPETTFLPAQKTWIEYTSPPTAYDLSTWCDPRAAIDPNGKVSRTGWLLEQSSKSRSIISITEAFQQGDFFGSTMRSPDCLDLETGRNEFGRQLDAFGPDNMLIAFLLFINTPKVIGRQQHMPHRGLEKSLLRDRKLIGHFPLHAWTEIKLHIGVPVDMQSEVGGEAHLTGNKALHFCRAHLRVRLGRLEFVRSHWRGDPALGIKRSRYKLSA